MSHRNASSCFKCARNFCEGISRHGGGGGDLLSRYLPCPLFDERTSACWDQAEVPRSRLNRRDMLSNTIRGHMAELGVISAKGRNGTAELLKIIANKTNDCIPAAAQFSLDVLARQYAATTAEIGVIEKRIHAWHRSCEESQRLEEIPGIGPIVATALVAEVGDWKAFSSGRNLAAWIGLVPKQHSTGGKDRLGGISKQGNRYLRWLLVAGAMAVIRYARQHGTKRLWLVRDPRRTSAAARRVNTSGWDSDLKVSHRPDRLNKVRLTSRCLLSVMRAS